MMFSNISTKFERMKMPVYVYHCDNCGVQFEKQQKFSDAPLVRCPECGKKSLRKVYSPVGIVFKGSGFYATDHRSPSGAQHQVSKTKDGGKKSNESKNEKPANTSKEVKAKSEKNN